MPTPHIKEGFPIFQNRPDHIASPSVPGRPAPVYLDSAATSLKPSEVIAAERDYEERYSANIGRGLYPLAEEATAAYEATRGKVARFLNASPEEIIFTSGTTDGLNMVARLVEPLVIASRQQAEKQSLLPGDCHGRRLPRNDHKKNIVVTALEHHSNYLPWKELGRRTGAELRVVPFSDDGSLAPGAFSGIIDQHTAVVAFSAVSNVFGLVNPVTDIVRAIRTRAPHAVIVVDAAQAVAHTPIDVREWDADFVAFSSHKVYGPTGVGVLSGKKSVLERLAPTEFGGGMVIDSCADETQYQEIPHRFEAGTPNISGIIGFGTALDFATNIGFNAIQKHDQELSSLFIQKLRETFGDSVHILGNTDPTKRAGLVSFTLDGLHPHDIAHLLGESGICVRAGEHCAAPLHRALGIPASVRVSFGIYNTEEDIQKMILALKKIAILLG